MKRIILALLSSFIISTCISQEEEGKHKESHDDHTNEIGIANSPVYFLKEKTLAYGFHAHYVRSLNNSKFGYGLGYEHIFDEHKHTTVSLVGSYRYKAYWNFIASPGITFENKNYDEPKFSFHAEASYEYELGDVHIGPVFEVAYDPEDIHISLGLHVGYCF